MGNLIRMVGGVAEDAEDWWAHRDLPIVDRRQAIIRYNLRRPLAEPRGTYHYSNLAYRVADAMAERVAGTSWRH